MSDGCLPLILHAALFKLKVKLWIKVWPKLCVKALKEKEKVSCNFRRDVSSLVVGKVWKSSSSMTTKGSDSSEWNAKTWCIRSYSHRTRSTEFAPACCTWPASVLVCVLEAFLHSPTSYCQRDPLEWALTHLLMPCHIPFWRVARVSGAAWRGLKSPSMYDAVYNDLAPASILSLAL